MQTVTGRPATPRDPTSSSHPASTSTAWIILLLVFLVRIPFLLIHHIQEDAYITFRTARHLAEQGDFSFNLHQHFPGTTSLLYPLVVAALDLVLHSRMVLGVQLLGTLCVAGACYLAARSLVEDNTQRLTVWLLSACWPVSLLVSYEGMETPLLLLALGAAIYALARKAHPALFAASMLALPLIRPDALAYGIVFCAAMLMVDRWEAVRGSSALALGCALLLLGNRIISGQFLPATARAKEIAYHPSHAPAAVMARLWDVFFHQSFLLPVATSYLTRLGPVMLVIVLAAFVLAFRQAATRRKRVLLAALALLTVAVPAAYAAGGVLFDWYFYPAAWMALTVVIAVGVHLLAAVRWRRTAWVSVWVLVAMVWTGLAGLQWARALAASTQDYHYRADIGRYLREISHGQGTLFLEPAGYIPYFSGLRTDDEVGLVSNRITHYMLRDPSDWWISYVEAERPDYIVQREGFAHFETFEGYTLTPSEQRWFQEHYRLLRRVHYNPSLYHPSPYLQRILALGPMSDYLIYERRDLPPPR
ncbi:MAG: hypothetical protein ACR2JE_03035 [Acidobacteriaceae bacterium]